MNYLELWDIIQGPYAYPRYLESGMQPEQINIIMSTFNIVSSIWGLFVGYALDFFGHKRLIIIQQYFYLFMHF